MIPKLSGGIDHIHVYVSSRRKAADWYKNMLGFESIKELAFWTGEKGGPLTIRNAEDTIHLALFRSAEPRPCSIAFGASGDEYFAWRTHLKSLSFDLREEDHEICWSTYFDDPFGNHIEITTYDYEEIKQAR